jgi:hypothetical protein
MSRMLVCSSRSARVWSGWGWGRLTAADVSVFLARECPLRTVAGARSLVVVLRSLLRYLHVAG